LHSVSVSVKVLVTDPSRNVAVRGKVLVVIEYEILRLTLKRQCINFDRSAVREVELSNTGQLPSKRRQNLAKTSYGSDKFLLV